MTPESWRRMTSANHPSDPLAPPAPRPACPTNHKVGPGVDSVTLKALLALPLTAVAPDSAYRFCPTPDCPTVYYRADGQQVFSEVDLRERVYQKHRDDPSSVICYCFGHTLADVRAALARGQ